MKTPVFAITAAAVMAAAIQHGAPSPIEEPPEADRIPDRLSVDPTSRFYDPIYRRIGVRFNGVERRGDVQEYCMSEGRIVVRRRSALGKFMTDSEGRYLFATLHGGDVVAYLKDGRPTRVTAPAYGVQSAEDAKARLDAAAAKRARKAAKLAATRGVA